VPNGFAPVSTVFGSALAVAATMTAQLSAIPALRRIFVICSEFAMHIAVSLSVLGTPVKVRVGVDP